MQFATLPQQLMSMLHALIFGAVCAAAYDGIRALRRFIIPDGRGTVTLANIFDILYGIALGAAYSVFVFAANSGKNRGYLLFSCAVGFVLYRLSVGRLIKVLLEKTADILRKMIGAVLKTVLLPAKWLIKQIKNACRHMTARRKYIKTEKERARRKKNSRFGRVRQDRAG